jgi:dihydrofolate synthase / folylpolyglutamate synthase
VDTSLTQQERSAIDWLYSTQLFGVKLGLENVRRLLAALELPEPKQKFIHIAGTNGKGSVSAFVHSLLKTSGVNAGIFTSPHLIQFRERIKDAERMISPEELVAWIEKLKRITHDWDPHPTFFELTFAIAMGWFAQRGLEWIVLETGMGGRLDATNAIDPVVSIITSIGYDHMNALGNTLEEIAYEKAGIIKPGKAVVTLRQKPEAMEVLAKTARDRGSPLFILTNPMRGYQLGLYGQHQLWNAALAVQGLKTAGFKLTDSILREGLQNVDWPARFQSFEKGQITVDGAHNLDAAETLVRTWHQAYPREKASVIYGGVTSKDVLATMRALQPIAARWHFARFQSPRAVPPEQLKEALATAYRGAVTCEVHESVETALIAARRTPERILVAGSLYLAGEMLAHLTGETQQFQRSAQ